MTTKLVKFALALTLGLLVASVASAQSQTNTNTNCNAYGSSIDCTSTSTTTQSGPTAAQVEQQKEMNENAAKTGAALGSIIAMKRAQHAEEKNELTAVTFCRQNPAGTWTFPNKAPMPCTTLEKNAVAYCTVNSKKSICKDIAKLPPSSVQIVDANEQRVTVNVVYCQQNPNGIVTTGTGEKQNCNDELAHVKAECTVRGWIGKPCDALAGKLSGSASTAAMNKLDSDVERIRAQQNAGPAVVELPPQVQLVLKPGNSEENLPAAQPTPVGAVATPTPEVSVAEAARQARIAKAVREAIEKAEQDNPAPPQK